MCTWNEGSQFYMFSLIISSDIDDECVILLLIASPTSQVSSLYNLNYI